MAKTQAGRGVGLVAAGLGWGLALGVGLGTLVLAPALDGTFGGAESGASKEALTSESDAGRGAEQVAAADDLLGAHVGTIVAGALDGVPVTVIRSIDAADDDAAAVRWDANLAGAEDAGSITLTSKFFKRDAADELATIIATTLPAGAQLSVENRSPGTHAGESLAAVLAADPGTGDAAASAEDRAFVLDALQEAGFIKVTGEVAPARAFVLVDGERDASSFGADTLRDFAVALAEHARVVLATSGEAPEATGVVSVSDVDTEAGRIAAVFAAAQPAAGTV